MSGVERRKSKRRPIVESFALAVCIPKKGMLKLAVRDVSDDGMYFDLDTEGEEPSGFPLNEGESLDVSLYLNPSLFLPLSVKVMRIEEHDAGRRVGTEFKEKKSKSYHAYEQFLKMLDHIYDVAELNPK